MKKKCLKKFVALFDHLEIAGRFANHEFLANRDNGHVFNSLSDAAERIKQILFPDYHGFYFVDEQNALLPEEYRTFMQDLTDEIEQNLYKYPHDKKIYLGDIIRLLYPIAPYLDTETDVVINEDGTVSNPDYPNYNEYHYITSQFLKGSLPTILEFDPGWDFTRYERYLAQCLILMIDFAKRLDKLCLNHGLDIIKIQQELGIFFLPEKRFR